MAQGQVLARWVAEQDPPAAVLSSPLRRCRETAAPAAAAARLPVRCDPGCARCTSAGRRDDHRRDAAGLRRPARRLPPRPGRVAAARRGGSGRRGTTRVSALEDAATAHPDATVLVVTHNTLTRLVLCAVLGIPLSSYRRTFPELGNVAPPCCACGTAGGPCCTTTCRCRGDTAGPVASRAFTVGEARFRMAFPRRPFSRTGERNGIPAEGLP
ncbi:histidine phosphatase family protein [Streptomyces sp. M19]